MKKGYVTFLLGGCALVILFQLGLPNAKSISESFSLSQSNNSKNSDISYMSNIAGFATDSSHMYKEEVVSALMTPITCDQNVSTHAYFNIGAEQLRISNNSIIGVEPGSTVEAKALTYDQNPVRSGCQGNPYIVRSKLSIAINNSNHRFHFPDIGIDKFESFYVESIPMQDRSGASFVQSSIEEIFEHCKSNGLEIDELSSGLFQCIETRAKNVRGSDSTQMIYMSSPDQYSTLTGRPFVLMCHKAKDSISCYTRYRLLPSVDVGYSFKTQNFKPEKLIEFDTEVRKSIEEIRVKSS